MWAANDGRREEGAGSVGATESSRSMGQRSGPARETRGPAMGDDAVRHHRLIARPLQPWMSMSTVVVFVAVLKRQ